MLARFAADAKFGTNARESATNAIRIRSVALFASTDFISKVFFVFMELSPFEKGKQGKPLLPP